MLTGMAKKQNIEPVTLVIFTNYLLIHYIFDMMCDKY